jgi:hypothetical protein
LEGLDGIILISINKEEAKKLIEEFHSWYCGGFYLSRRYTNDD